MMKKMLSSKAALIFLTLSFLLIPSITNAVTVTYLQPGYTSSVFLNLNFDTRSMAFDNSGNLYTSNIANDNSGTIYIQELYAATGYTTSSSSLYTSYLTTTAGATGLVFDNMGNLIVSEFNAGGNSGLIRKIDATTKAVVDTINLPAFRPTGVEAASGNIYFNGRLNSNNYFGNIYKTDFSSHTINFLFGPFVGKGIAIDGSGDIFSATAGGEQSAPYLNNAIYMFDPSTLTPSEFAQFDTSSGELTFDKAGNLYALFDANNATTIMRISAVPEPSLMVLLGISVLSIVGLRRWWKD